MELAQQEPIQIKNPVSQQTQESTTAAVTSDIVGKKEFENFACMACHTQGSTTAPDLTGVTRRREHDWLVQWIMSPEKMYTDKIIAPQIQKYNIKMPDQKVPKEDAEKIVEYLKPWK